MKSENTNKSDTTEEITSYKTEYVDLTEECGFGDRPTIRVSLTKLLDPISGKKVDIKDKILGESYITGVIEEDSLPKEGEQFEMYFNSHNGVPAFGSSAFPDVLKSVVRENNYIYFVNHIDECYRLEILDKGN